MIVADAKCLPPQPIKVMKPSSIADRINLSSVFFKSLLLFELFDYIKLVIGNAECFYFLIVRYFHQ